jgi:hypothetical protein
MEFKSQKEKEQDNKLADELKHIEMWKIKRMIKKLENSKGYVPNTISYLSLALVMELP